ncbi:hypothetical protein HDE_05630 [Halotydeus destructor]|nr:hypothetical protein HDE_05630 [Halotydeus destructor]
MDSYLVNLNLAWFTLTCQCDFPAINLTGKLVYLPVHRREHLFVAMLPLLLLACLCVQVSLGQQSSSSTPATPVATEIDLVTEVSNLTSATCEKNWHQHMRRCFFIDPTYSHVTFDEAQARCQEEFDGDLVSIETEETQIFLTSVLSNLNITNDIWLGARYEVHDGHDDHHGGGFHWILSDTTVKDYQNWDSSVDLKGNVTNTCAYLSPEHKWKVEACSAAKMMLCERDIEKKTKDKNMLWITAYIMLAIIIIALLIGCLVYCLSRQQGESRRANGGKFSGIYYKKSSNRKGNNAEL